MSEITSFKFENQADSAEKLVEIIPKNELAEGGFIIVCLGLRSVVLTENIANALNMSYELFFSEQIFAPNNPECEIAVVGETEEIVINDELARAFDITQDYIYGEAHRRYEEKILKNVYKYRKGALLSELAGSNILLVDDGCQTGATALVAIKTFINLAAKSVFYAAPVIPTDLAESLISVADGVYCARKIADYVDSDFYYKAKIAPEPDEILRILEDSPHYLPLQKIVN